MRDLLLLINQIDEIINANPNSVEVWGLKIAKHLAKSLLIKDTSKLPLWEGDETYVNIQPEKENCEESKSLD